MKSIGFYEQGVTSVTASPSESEKFWIVESPRLTYEQAVELHKDCLEQFGPDDLDTQTVAEHCLLLMSSDMFASIEAASVNLESDDPRRQLIEAVAVVRGKSTPNAKGI